MRHILKDILAIFAHGAEHTHETAVQATYDAGHAAGKEEGKAEATTTVTAAHEESLAEKLKAEFEKGYAEAKQEFEAGLHSLDGKKTTGATSNVSKEEITPSGAQPQTATSSQAQKAASAPAA